MLFDVLWQGMEHVVHIERLDIPVLGAMRKDDFGFDLVRVNQIVAVMPKLIVVPCFAIEIFF